MRLHYCRAGYKTSKPHCHAATAAIATTKNRTNDYTRAERNSSTKGRFIVDVVDGVFDADGDHQVDTFWTDRKQNLFITLTEPWGTTTAGKFSS